MRFNYQARTKEGQMQSGVVEASSRDAALRVLQKYGLFITFLEESREPFYAKKIPLLERITRKDVVIFSRQLAIMAKSSVPIIEALHSLVGQTQNRNFKEKIFRIAEEVEGGASLSQAFGRFPEIFSAFYVNMIKSGEASGKISETLEYLADHSEREYQFYSKLVGALIYPIFVLVVFVGVVTLLFIVVLPNLITVLEESGGTLPWSTRAIIASSLFFQKWWWLVLGIVIASILGLSRFAKTKEGREAIDRISLRIPLVGPFLKKIYLTRIAENLSTLIGGGLPIVQALEITGDVAGNTLYKETITYVKEGVRRGESISGILSMYPDLFPPLFTQMAVVGERTGQLDTSLLNIVSFYQKDVERTLESLISLLEPIMIIGLGVVVAIVLMAVVLPLYQTVQLEGGGM